MFPDLIETLTLCFSRTLFKRDLSILRESNIAWSLPIRSKFDDLDFDHVSRSQVCHNTLAANLVCFLNFIFLDFYLV